MGSLTQETCLVMGIMVVGLVYVVMVVVETMGRCRASLLLPDYCCFPATNPALGESLSGEVRVQTNMGSLLPPSQPLSKTIAA